MGISNRLLVSGNPAPDLGNQRPTDVGDAERECAPPKEYALWPTRDQRGELWRFRKQILNSQQRLDRRGRRFHHPGTTEIETAGHPRRTGPADPLDGCGEGDIRYGGRGIPSAGRRILAAQGLNRDVGANGGHIVIQTK